jgi:hypothetical protein
MNIQWIAKVAARHLYLDTGCCSGALGIIDHQLSRSNTSQITGISEYHLFALGRVGMASEGSYDHTPEEIKFKISAVVEFFLHIDPS